MFTDNYKREYNYWLLFKKNEKKKQVNESDSKLN
jgi:hypothetical protein